MVNKPITVYDAEGMTIGHKLVYKDWQARENVRSHSQQGFFGTLLLLFRSEARRRPQQEQRIINNRRQAFDRFKIISAILPSFRHRQLVKR